MTAPSPRWVAGVDGCRSGWLVVLRELTTGTSTARVVAEFRALMALPETPEIIAVDVPIGLLGAARTGGRDCEIEARRILGKRASSVFNSPSRGALDAFRAGGAFAAVSAANRGGVATAPGLSQQTFALLPKIAEVDGAMAATDQARVREVHPELCFAQAAGRPMTYSKKKLPGRTERLAVLATLGFAQPLSLFGGPRPQGAEVDDVLDACIACWTAERVATGWASVTPSTPPIDDRGLRMELWV